MDRTEVISKIKEERLVAVIRAENSKQGMDIIDAVVKGGINIIEVTMTVPNAVDIIEELGKKYNDSDVVIGAGTVLDPETARIVILAGAKFVVSPMLNTDVVKMCNRYRVAAIPGVMTVKESVEALEMGVDILKVFPGNAFSPSIISAFNGPLPQAQYMPTGGVDIDNVEQWINSGAVAVGTGSNLTKSAKTGDFDEITKKAEQFVNKIKNIR